MRKWRTGTEPLCRRDARPFASFLKPPVNPDAPNASGSTALSIANREKHVAIEAYLRSVGALN